MYMSGISFSLIAFLPLLIFGGASVQAAAVTPHEAPIHISANQFHFNQKTGRGSYRGQVVIIQVKLKLTGDKLDIRTTAKGAITQLTLIGHPARFQDVTPSGKPIDGHAGKILYRPGEKTMILDGDAFIQQNGDTFRSAHIVYRPTTGEILAGQAGQRVQAEFTPSPSQSKSSKP